MHQAHAHIHSTGLVAERAIGIEVAMLIPDRSAVLHTSARKRRKLSLMYIASLNEKIHLIRIYIFHQRDLKMEKVYVVSWRKMRINRGDIRLISSF